MFNLTDILMQAQGGEAARNLARQFGLSPDQAEAVLAAFAPAFAASMNRQMQEPNAIGQVLGLMAQTNRTYADAFEGMATAFQPETRDAGNQALGALFGSKDASRAVADQVAAMTGVGSPVLKSMLPVVASMMMGGLNKSMGATPMGAMLGGATGGNGGFADLVGAFMNGFSGKAAAPPVLSDLFGALMSGGDKGGPQAPPQALDTVVDHLKRQSLGQGATVGETLARTPNPAGPETALGDLLGSLVGGFNRGRPEPVPEPEPEPDATAQLTAMMGQLFQAGRQVQDQHQAAFEQIFDRFLTRKA
jgi:hypothetical protein